MSQRACLLRIPVFCGLILGLSLATIAADDNVRVLEDVPYKATGATEYERARCQLDFYLPPAGKAFATIVWFHGGGLTGGDKAGGYVPALGRRLAGEGIAVASVNYRLSPQAKFPA